ncbi:MAG: type II toxin-antitoxin system HicB family antitoxin [Lachnospiraceae bacterium]|nr:type II toxin-antitoxin system HicB family antitoxin [Lachnospiraceae bacterium]
MVRGYYVTIKWSPEDASYIAEAPELPGCMADGKTYAETLENVTVAIDEWIETARALGRQIPRPARKSIIAEKRNVICNTAEENDAVMTGHDCGDAVWIRAVHVREGERITANDVVEEGEEISVDKEFFERYLKSIFLDYFNSGIQANRNRFTYAFSDEGRYLAGFEEGILEHNFFTYTQFEEIIEKVEEFAESMTNNDKINADTANQLRRFVIYANQIMAGSPNTNMISVSS